MVIILSVNLKSKILLRKEIYGDYKKKSLKPRENGIGIKSAPLESAWSKTLHRTITAIHLEHKEKALFCMGSTDVSPFLLFFVFS